MKSKLNNEPNPDLKKMKMKIESQVIKKLDLSRNQSDEQVLHLIDDVISQTPDYMTVGERITLRKQVFNSMRGLDVLTPLLEDESVTEIMVNGYDRIFIERYGALEKTSLSFDSRDKYHNLIRRIVSECNREVNEANPIVDARLKDGSRVNVVLDTVSIDGSCLTIRKFPKEAMTMEDLIGIDSLSEDIAYILKLFVLSGYNIIISGGTGTGKTTFLNALGSYIPENERVITIEDSAELNLKRLSNLVRLEVRNSNGSGSKAVSMRDLIKTSLRMRPNRIIVGEVRGSEAMDMLAAMSTGHDGSFGTLHSNSAVDALRRLETMCLMGTDMPVSALRAQIAQAVDIIIQLKRLRDHTRKVVSIVEVLDVRNDEIVCNELFKFVEEGNKMQNSKIENGVVVNKKIGNGVTGNSKTLPEDEQYEHRLVQGQLFAWHKLQQINKLREAGYYEYYLEGLKRCRRISKAE